MQHAAFGVIGLGRLSAAIGFALRLNAGLQGGTFAAAGRSAGERGGPALLRRSRRLIAATAVLAMAGAAPVLPAGAESKSDGVLDVVAQNYFFEGDLSDTTVEPGRYSLNFSNPTTADKPELHEIVVFLLRDGQSLDDAFNDIGKVKFIGHAFAPDGGTSTGRLKLDKEGRYGIACFLPVNSDTADEGDDGPPHAFNFGGGRMIGEFFVASD